MHLLGGGVVYTLVLSSNQNNVNVRTALSNPTTPGDVYVIVNSGVVIGTSGSGIALDFGSGWPAGFTFTLINNGSVEGFGGNANSGNGGDALALRGNTTIDNTNGYLFGGGGGGQQGLPYADFHQTDAGGGGGGGRGNTGGNGGAKTGTGTGGSNGSNGSTSGPGAGGAAGSGPFGHGGDGGAGGDWGASGQYASANSNGQIPGVSPGAAGKAIDLNSFTVTWRGGNNSAQVKGAVS
jgi:hypothetical protein